MPNLSAADLKRELPTEKVMRLVDYTNLKAFAQERQIETLIQHASELGAYAICILPVYAEFARGKISGGGLKLKLAIVVDYPLGAGTDTQRMGEVRSLAGIADEVDAVVQISKIKSGKFDEAQKDMVDLTGVAHSLGMKIKFIIETAYLTKAEKQRVSEIAFRAGADFVKTSSGFAEKEYTASVGNSNTGATVDDIKLIAAVSKRLGRQKAGIKASGGINTADQIFELLASSNRKPDPDCFRIGASHIDNIYHELRTRKLGATPETKKRKGVEN